MSFQANPANTSSVNLTNKSALLLACGWETEALFRSLQHTIYSKERNKRLGFIHLLFSNPSYYRTGAMLMMDSFREHFLPAHITVLQTEAKAVWGGYKSCKCFSVPYTTQCFKSASKQMSQQWAAGLTCRKLHPIPHCATMFSYSFSKPHIARYNCEKGAENSEAFTQSATYSCNKQLLCSWKGFFYPQCEWNGSFTLWSFLSSSSTSLTAGFHVPLLPFHLQFVARRPHL